MSQGICTASQRTTKQISPKSLQQNVQLHRHFYAVPVRPVGDCYLTELQGNTFVLLYSHLVGGNLLQQQQKMNVTSLCDLRVLSLCFLDSIVLSHFNFKCVFIFHPILRSPQLDFSNTTNKTIFCNLSSPACEVSTIYL